MIREAIVNGQFYPKGKSELKKMIESFTPKVNSRIKAKGVILPHAGYIYSGKVAVVTVSQILPKKKIIILGPNHTGWGNSFSIWAKGSWRTPFKDIRIDVDLAGKILGEGSEIAEDYTAHAQEHSIEVELPILSYFFDEFNFVPICCQISNLKKYQKVAEQIASAIKNIKEDVLIVASTDLTHYEPEESARTKDRLALEQVINLDEEGLLSTVKKQRIY